MPPRLAPFIDAALGQTGQHSTFNLFVNVRDLSRMASPPQYAGNFTCVVEENPTMPWKHEFTATTQPLRRAVRFTKSMVFSPQGESEFFRHAAFWLR